jgi:hypothetical protein
MAKRVDFGQKKSLRKIRPLNISAMPQDVIDFLFDSDSARKSKSIGHIGASRRKVFFGKFLSIRKYAKIFTKSAITLQWRPC